MVDFNNTKETQEVRQLKAEVDLDVVCPQCHKPLGKYTAMLTKTDRYGREMREYFGWCLDCDQGNEVVQFKEYGRWQIHKCRYFADIGDGTGALPSSEWQVINKLPDPPAVMLGPGGDYDKAVDMDQLEGRLYDGLLSALEKVVRVLRQLKKLRGHK